MSEVHVVVNVIDGIIDMVQVYAVEEDAMHCYRMCIKENSPFTRKEIIEIHIDNKEEFDSIWHTDSDQYLYDAETDCYYPKSTESHDVMIYEEVVN